MSENRFKLVRTCFACPEQYDVYVDGELRGYFRLRHGSCRADLLPSKEVVYSTEAFAGDGMFEIEEERVKHLNAACRALAEKIDDEHKTEEPIYDVSEREEG